MLSSFLLVITNKEQVPLLGDEVKKHIKGVIAREKVDLDHFQCILEKEQILSYNALKSFPTNFTPDSHPKTFTIINNIIQNQHTFFIIARQKNNSESYNYENPFNNIEKISCYSLNSQNFLRDLGIRSLLFTSMPHDLESWVLFHTAHYLGIQCLVIRESALPWRAIAQQIEPNKKFGYEVIATLKRPHSHNVLSKAAQLYIEKKKGSYTAAEPTYMKQQKKDSFDKIWGKISSIKQKNENVSALHKAYRKVRDYEFSRKRARLELQNTLDGFVQDTLPTTPFITLFLHYQPERTSIPEGGQFSSQLLAIHFLLALLPEGWTLLIKEHPSTLMLPAPKPFRTPNFYTLITQFPNIRLVSPTHDSFRLIDKSEAVSTLTGRVGFEALCRKTPTIILGDAAYKELPGVIDLSQEERPDLDLHHAISQMKEELQNETIFAERLLESEASSFYSESPKKTEESVSAQTISTVIKWLSSNQTSITSTSRKTTSRDGMSL